MAAGVLLVAEVAAFMLSGWSPERFADPSGARQVLSTGGGMLQAAAVFGFAGLATTVLLSSGLAVAVRGRSPTLAAGVVLFAIIGAAGHSLVPLSLWVGVPEFLLAWGREPQFASPGWVGFHAVLSGAQGVGNLFLGLSMTCAGAALMAEQRGWRGPAVVGLCAGVMTLVSLAIAGRPSPTLMQGAFLPTLALTIVYRFWNGLQLFRGARSSDAS